MGVARDRVRGLLRRPVPDDLVALGRREFLTLTPDEAHGYTRALDQVLGLIDRLDELPQPQRPLRYVVRDIGQAPDPVENPYHALAWRCDIPGATEGPLAGLSAAVKDNIAVAGVPIGNGSRTAPYVPTRDAACVERLLDAGARIVGKTNMDDFAMAGTAETSALGPTRNPHDPRRSAGGSSGGTGSAVAGGLVDIGIGVDEGGSGRIPAAYCGVISLKPTHGLVPSHGVGYVDHTIDYVCPTARSVELVARTTDAISGHDDRDPQWVRARPEPTRCLDAVEGGVAGLRIAVVEESVDDRCEAGVREGFQTACGVLAAAGADVVSVSIPLWTDAWPIGVPLYAMSTWAMFESGGQGWGHLGESDPDRAHAFALVRRAESDAFPPLLKTWLLLSEYIREHSLIGYFGKAQNLRRALCDQVSTALRHCDLLVTPTTLRAAPLLLEAPVADVDLIERLVSTRGGNTTPLNLTGHPAIAVPAGVDENRMPVSIQIIARHFEDARAISAAAVIEHAMPVPCPPDARDSQTVGGRTGRDAGHRPATGAAS